MSSAPIVTSRHGGARCGLAVTNAPTGSPAETLRISPEGLEVANTYLACQSIEETSRTLGIPTDIVSSFLQKSDIRQYVDSVFLDLGYNNSFKLSSIMDAVIAKKLQTMDEADIGSDKDIIDILALKHKMTLDVLDRQIKLETARNTGVRNQTNVQINGGSAYDSLLEKLISKG